MKTKVQLFLAILLHLFAILPVCAQTSVGFSNPLTTGSYYVKQDFGNYNSKHANFHLGEDWCPNTPNVSAPVYAAYDGVVKHTMRRTGYGHVVIIEHTLPSGEKICSLYGHLGDNDLITVGSIVKKSQLIGRLSLLSSDFGSIIHLHFGIRKGLYTSTWVYMGYSSTSVRDAYWFDPTNFIANSKNSFFITMSNGWTLPSAIVRNQTNSFTVMLQNVGNRDFSGTVAIALLNGNKEYLGDIGVNVNQSIRAGYAKAFTFTKTITSAPGSYYVVARIKPLNGSWYDVTATSYVANPVSATITEKRCDMPVGVSHSSIGSTYVKINWSYNCNGEAYSIDYRIRGTTIWTTVSNIPYWYYYKYITGLRTATQYEYRIRRNCSTNDSPNSAIATFTTAGTLKSSAEVNEEQMVDDTLSKMSDVEENKNIDCIIWPNPTENILHIESNNTAEYLIVDLLGVLQQQGVLQKGENVIEVQHLAKGTYVIKAQKTYLFVKQ